MNLHKEALQARAKGKLADASLLYEHQRYSSSYYIYGYAVEMGLKACIAILFSADAIPDKSLVLKVYTHDLKELVKTAGLSLALKEARNRSPAADSYWAIVEQWTVESRYDSIDPFLARAMNEAVSHPTDGVFKWITSHW